MDVPPVTHVTREHHGAFVIVQDGERLGTMTYTLAGDVAIIQHTEVSEALRGTGAGKLLVAAAVEWARRDGKRITPLCSFAKRVFDRTPEYADVLVG